MACIAGLGRRVGGGCQRRGQIAVRPRLASSASTAGVMASTMVLSPGSALPSLLDAPRPGSSAATNSGR